MTPPTAKKSHSKIKAISKANLPFIILLIFSSAFPVLGNAGDLKTHDISYISNPILLEGVVKSMNGPQDQKTLTTGLTGKPELLWITGFTASAVDATTGKARTVGNLCHTGLSIASSNQRPFSTPNTISVQQYAVMFPGVPEMQFPKGMGLPFSSDEKLRFMAMGFNQDATAKIPPQVFNLTLHYVPDSEARGEIRPLFHRMARLWLPIKGAHGENCDMYPEEKKVDKAFVGDANWAAHWMVPPGRHVYTHVINDGFVIKRDTTLHYITMHLHPYGQSVELRDTSTRQTVWKGYAHYKPGTSEISSSDIYSSVEGIPVFKDHHYLLVAEYDNTTKHPVDAMAMLYFYLADTDFKKDTSVKGVASSH